MAIEIKFIGTWNYPEVTKLTHDVISYSDLVNPRSAWMQPTNNVDKITIGLRFTL